MENSFVEHYTMERMGKPLDEYLKQNEEYQKRKKQYRDLYDEIEKCLDDGAKASSLLAELDEAVGDYSASYGDAAYFFGFHDGMEMGLEHKIHTLEETKPENGPGITLEDMVSLIEAEDDLHDMDKALEQLAGHDHASGEFIKLDNIFNVILRNSHEYYREQSEEKMQLFYQIIMSRNMSPEERADILLNGTVRLQ